MFRWRTARRSVLTLAPRHACRVTDWCNSIANVASLMVAAVLALGIASIGHAAEEAVQATTALPTSLKLGVHYNDPAVVERLRDQSRKALAMASHFEEFECRLSNDVLNCARGDRIVLEGPFQDELLNIPVSGHARLEGSFRVATVPDQERACVEIHITGTVDMHGVGQTQGVRIESDAVARFQAMKRLHVDHEGARALPATCTAESSLVFTGIHSRPRLLGKFAERIAQQAREKKRNRPRRNARSTSSAPSRWCSIVKETEWPRLSTRQFKNTWPRPIESRCATWHQTRFRTEADSILMSRIGTGSAPLAPWQPVAGQRTPSILLRLPRTAFRADQSLLALGLVSDPASQPPKAESSSDETTRTLRPSVSWQEKTVTLAVDLESVARVAREPTIGASQ